jgi:hypothetical protein
MLTVAKEFVEHHADSKEVCRDVPTREIGSRGLVRRCARHRVHAIAYTRGDVEVKELRSRSRQYHVVRFDVAVNQAFAFQFSVLPVLGLRQVALTAFGI